MVPSATASNLTPKRENDRSITIHTMICIPSLFCSYFFGAVYKFAVSVVQPEVTQEGGYDYHHALDKDIPICARHDQRRSRRIIICVKNAETLGSMVSIMTTFSVGVCFQNPPRKRENDFSALSSDALAEDWKSR